MVAVAKEVGAHRFRESYGRYFEDFTEGDVYELGPAAPSVKPTTPGSRF